MIADYWLRGRLVQTHHQHTSPARREDLLSLAPSPDARSYHRGPSQILDELAEARFRRGRARCRGRAVTISQHHGQHTPNSEGQWMQMMHHQQSIAWFRHHLTGRMHPPCFSQAMTTDGTGRPVFSTGPLLRQDDTECDAPSHRRTRSGRGLFGGKRHVSWLPSRWTERTRLRALHLPFVHA